MSDLSFSALEKILITAKSSWPVERKAKAYFHKNQAKIMKDMGLWNDNYCEVIKDPREDI